MEKKRIKRPAIITAIAVMLVLSIAAAAYIVKITRDRAVAEAPQAPQEPAAEAPEPAEVPSDEEMKAKLAHIYVNSGSSSEEKYTMAAFDSAVEAGCVSLSMPVAVSGDGIVYIANDDNLYDMTGMNAYLSGMTEGQIANVKTKGGNDLVRLSDVFEKYGTDVNYVIEVIYADDRNIMPFIEAVKKAGVTDVMSVSSSSFKVLNRMEIELPDVPKVILCEEDAVLSEARGRDSVDVISVSRELMNGENLAAVHDSGKKFGAWTLNSEEDIRAALDLGVDSYFTDEGALAAEIEKAR